MNDSITHCDFDRLPILRIEPGQCVQVGSAFPPDIAQMRMKSVYRSKSARRRRRRFWVVLCGFCMGFVRFLYGFCVVLRAKMPPTLLISLMRSTTVQFLRCFRVFFEFHGRMKLRCDHAAGRVIPIHSSVTRIFRHQSSLFVFPFTLCAGSAKLHAKDGRKISVRKLPAVKSAGCPILNSSRACNSGFIQKDPVNIARLGHC